MASGPPLIGIAGWKNSGKTTLVELAKLLGPADISFSSKASRARPFQRSRCGGWHRKRATLSPRATIEAIADFIVGAARL